MVNFFRKILYFVCYSQQICLLFRFALAREFFIFASFSFRIDRIDQSNTNANICISYFTYIEMIWVLPSIWIKRCNRDLDYPYSKTRSSFLGVYFAKKSISLRPVSVPIPENSVHKTIKYATSSSNWSIDCSNQCARADAVSLALEIALNVLDYFVFMMNLLTFEDVHSVNIEKVLW